MLAKRRTREKQVTEVPETAVHEDASRELHAMLDQELSRLPDKYRTAIVLCDLGGKTRKEAARQLSVAEGTLAGRLTRGRTLLAKRLTQRGLVVSGGMLAADLSRQVASAAVPTPVLSSTIRAVTLVAAAQATTGAVSVHVAALSEGVVKAMLLTKLKNLTAVVLLAGLVTLAGGLMSYQATLEAQEGPAAKAGSPDPNNPTAPHKVASFEDFTGRLVDLQVKPGALPEAQLPAKPIVFRFDMDESSYRRYQRLLEAKKVKGSGDLLAVRLADETNFGRVGVLVYLEDKLNPDKGTIGVYGVLPNADGLLRPDMLVRVRMNFGPPPKAGDPVSPNAKNPPKKAAPEAGDKPGKAPADAATFTIKDVTIDQVDEAGGTISVSFGKKEKPTKLVNLALGKKVRVVASHVLPGSVNNLPFEWEYVKRLQGKVVSLRLDATTAGLLVVSIASGND